MTSDDPTTEPRRTRTRPDPHDVERLGDILQRHLDQRGWRDRLGPPPPAAASPAERADRPDRAERRGRRG